MNEQIRLLQAEIKADLEKIAETYAELAEIKAQPVSKVRDVTLGYYLHVLYGLFENMFARIAENFGNHIKDKSSWHSELLWRMTLDLMPIRPAAISQTTYQCLNELRGFRHLFRNAYLLRFDPIRLELVWQQAQTLQTHYLADLEQFLMFLDGLNEESQP